MTDLLIKKGTDSGYRWQVKDGDTQLPYDFTGWTVRSQVRKTETSADILHEWSSLNGNAEATADGYVILTWTAAVSTAWPWRFGVYDIELVSPDNRVIRLDSGRITAKPEVTR